MLQDQPANLTSGGIVSPLRDGLCLDDLLDQQGQQRPDPHCLFADLSRRAFDIAPMAGGHVLGKGGVPAIAAAAQVDAMRSPLRKISTVPAVKRAAASRRAKRCGTE